jgi:hypothetical protein
MIKDFYFISGLWDDHHFGYKQKFLKKKTRCPGDSSLELVHQTWFMKSKILHYISPAPPMGE